MIEREMFEKSFERPSNFFDLNVKKQTEIDKKLGILDWKGTKLIKEDKKRFNDYYNKK